MTLSLLASWPSTASAAFVRNYASWTVTGTAGQFGGSLDLGVLGLPDATISSDARVFTTARSATLTGATPFGAAFGTSSGRTYASIGATFGNTGPSSTTFAFDAATPTSGWGFALGDIDAEHVRVTATGADGEAVPASALGFAGVFNSTGGGTDLPDWDPSSGLVAGNPCPAPPAPTNCDTDGATAWFRPEVPLRTLTLHFTVIDGAPRFQTWFAANSTVVSGTVAGPSSAPPVTVRLRDPDGAVVTELVTSGPGFELPPLLAGPAYLVEVLVPDGWRNTEPSSIVLPTSSGSPERIRVRLERLPVEPTTTTTAPTTSTTTTIVPSTTTTSTTTTVPPTATTSVPPRATSPATPAAPTAPSTVPARGGSDQPVTLGSRTVERAPTRVNGTSVDAVDRDAGRPLRLTG